jgi:hypothetical protein
MKTKLFAFVHDGTFHGDSIFYFPTHPIPYEAGMSLSQIKDGHLTAVAKVAIDLGCSPEAVRDDVQTAREEHLVEIKGAVIVDEKVAKAMKAIWESEPGNDSAVYSCNRACKRVAWTLRRLTIGRGMYRG